MGSSAERRFYCTSRFKKAVRKAKHSQVSDQCETIQKLLATYPKHGETHGRHRKVRKMRVHVPRAGFGKRGGYRLIYRAVMDKEEESKWYVVFLDLYLKGDTEDLPDERYTKLIGEAEDVLSDTVSVDWETVPGTVGG